MATWAERMRRTKADMTDVPPGSGYPDGRDVVRGEAPVMDMRTPQFNAYRGQEDHGVPATVVPPDLSPPPDWTPPEWDPPAADIAPLPVKVVTESSDEYRAFRVGQFGVAGASVVQLLGRDRSRKTCRINNVSGSPVVIGHNTSLTITNGYFVQPGGATVSMDHTEPIYVLSYDGGNALLNIYQEYVVNPRDQDAGYSHG